MKPAVSLFFALGTQWRWIGGGMGPAVRIGLDYSAIPATALGLGLDVTPTLFSDIRTLESAALDGWSKRNRGRL